MELTVLGSSGTWPNDGTATSGYLVRHDGFNLYMDAGTGTLANLQQHIPLSDIHGIVITHEHPDHFVDLYPTFYARHYGELGGPGLPVFVPLTFAKKLADVVSEASQEAMRSAFDLREVTPGDGFRLGPFEIGTELMEHLGLPALGYRIDADGSVLAYTGDTGPSERVTKLAMDADVFLAEATWQEHNDLLPFHLSARQAAEHARDARVRRLVLTHIWPTLDREDSRSEAASVFDGPIDIAVEGMGLEVGA